jgi:hypothetical protein
MEKRLVIFAICLVVFASFASAAITLNDPEDIYNLGDKLYVTAGGLLGSEAGNLNINLVCGNQSTNLVKISARAFETKTEQSYSIPYKILDTIDLEIENVSSILGSCQVIASLGAQTAATKQFTITSDVYVTAALDKAEYNPGEGIKLDVTVTKANGDLLNGFIEGNNATSFNKAVQEGKVSETFSMPETAEAGSYVLDLRAYDVGSNGVLNEGRTQAYFTIKQVPSSMVMSLSSEEVIPGDKLTVGADLFDQSGKDMEGALTVEIANPLKEIMTYTVNAKEFLDIPFETNATPGEWIIAVSLGDIMEERTFVVPEVQKVNFTFDDTVLIVTNIGNAVYNKTIEVNIGEENLTLDLNMQVGEVRKFNLKAPEGEYEVSVDDGDTAVSQSVLLTGNAISIKDLKEGGIFKSYTLVWVFLILVLGSAGIILVVRYRRKTRTIGEGNRIAQWFRKFRIFHRRVKSKIPQTVRSSISNSINFTNKSPEAHSFDDSYSHEDKTLLDLTKKKIESAESTLVLKGQKLNSAVVAVSLKNNKSLNDNTKKELNNLLEQVKAMKGLVDWRDDTLLVVFSPLITKTYSNESIAVKAGLALARGMNEHNKKFSNRLEFNIGVHAGELVATIEGGKLRYTGIGNTVSLARRMADSDSKKVLISEEVRKKMLRDLKAEKDKMINDKQIYTVSDMKDREANQAKFKDLMKRVE